MSESESTAMLPTYLGIDVGTSGCRAILINSAGEIIQQACVTLAPPTRDGQAIEQDPDIWWEAVNQVLEILSLQGDLSQVAGICLDATSATVLLTDEEGNPVSTGLMYNDSRSLTQSQEIFAVAPFDSPTRSASSGLAKGLYLSSQFKNATFLLNQADWLSGKLCGRFGVSDENNALKLGYDVVRRVWPKWLSAWPDVFALLPDVLPVGATLDRVRPEIAEKYVINPDAFIICGTTDSIASVYATGICAPGEAVTSLGSTLVIKLISTHPVNLPEAGVYSHRFGDFWLAGGASNSGGAALLSVFSQAEIDELSEQIDPEHLTGLEYYPLASVGERFPVNDVNKKPVMTPVPENRVTYFQGLLESIAAIENQAYRLLEKEGATPAQSIRTTGGGAKNVRWAKIRASLMNVPVEQAKYTEAAYGSALIARKAFEKHDESL